MKHETYYALRGVNVSCFMLYVSGKRMNPKEYAQLLYETLSEKAEDKHDQILDRFKSLLVKNKESHLGTAIKKEFKKIQDKSEQEKFTYITSAWELSENQKKELEDILPRPHKFSENPSLLAGIAVRQGDNIYNATLRKRMESLKSSL